LIAYPPVTYYNKDNYNLRKRIVKLKQKGVDIMKFIISGKNIEITDGLRAAVQDKLGKLERYFTPETDIIVTLSVEKERQKIEVTIPVKGNIIRSEQVSNDMYVSIDLVEEVIERQLRKYKNKIVDKHQDGGNLQKAFIEKEVPEDDEVKIIRTKKFGIKPMYPEDACVQMELLGHNFFVFCNAETEEVNVVYKRKGNTYGLIEPEF
jgi:putative sigma-54 modulation protein